LSVPAQGWILIGLTGQGCFFLRFVVQWLASERAGQSLVPKAFWYLSIAGSVVILAYAISRRDPVFIVGQSTGLFVYVRNLVLIRRAEGRPDAAARCGRLHGRDVRG
jgi:lipid-A-disaccharide synthase-like uncharacterized protein